MKVTVLGASGNAGSAIVKELAARGHSVVGIARDPSKIPQDANITAVKGDANDASTLPDLLKGADAVVSAIFFSASDPEILINSVKQAGVSRYLVVGGAGSLNVGPGKLLVDSPAFPDIYRDEARAGVRFLDRLRQEADLDWTFLSPSAEFGGDQRTGQFRLGGDELLVDASGKSHISLPDYAIALVNELETPAHSRKRFTVGY